MKEFVAEYPDGRVIAIVKFDTHNSFEHVPLVVSRDRKRLVPASEFGNDYKIVPASDNNLLLENNG